MNDSGVPDPIEISISATKEDLQKTSYFLSRRTDSWSHVKAMCWGGGAFLAFFAEQWIVLWICLFCCVTGWATPWIIREFKLRQVPRWGFEPMVFALDETGVFIMAQQASRQLSWDAIQKVTLTDDDWIFSSAGQEPIILHRRTLSTEDDASIRKMAEYHHR